MALDADVVLMMNAADRLCCDHAHFSIASFDELLNIPVDTVFEHYFTDSVLFRDFVAAMKMSGKALPTICMKTNWHKWWDKRSKGMKQSTSGVRRSKVAVTRG